MGEIVPFPQQELPYNVATRAVFWCERPNLVHACEASGIEDGVLVAVTPCERGVPARLLSIYPLLTGGVEITCPACRRKLARPVSNGYGSRVELAPF
jgi:hypothetical protein